MKKIGKIPMCNWKAESEIGRLNKRSRCRKSEVDWKEIVLDRENLRQIYLTVCH